MYLFYQGAVINCRNKDDQFPDMVATSSGHTSIADFIHAVLSPPAPPTKIATLKGDHSSEFVCQYELACPYNYYPHIDVVEIQTKTGKFFDSWKTVNTLKSSQRPSVEEDAQQMAIQNIQFDKKCGQIPTYDDRTLELLRSHSAELEHRALPEKQWVSPPVSCVIDGYAPSQQLQVRIRCGNKYGFGGYSNGVNVELKSAKKKAKKEEIQFKPLSDSDSSEDSSSDSSSDSSEKAKKKHESQKKKHHDTPAKKDEIPAKKVDETPAKKESETPKTENEAPIQNTESDEDVMTSIVNEGVPTLLKKVEEGVDVSGLRSQNGSTLLHLAASQNQEELARYLVSNNINKPNASNEVVLVCVCEV